MRYFKGTITISTLLYVVGGALAIGGWVITYVNQQIVPVAAETQANQTAIASMQVDIQWIKAALAAKGFRPSSSTNQ